VTASALVLLAIGGLWQVGRTVLDGPREYHIAGLWCSEVEQHAQALMAGQERDAELLEHMSDHIDHCPHCGPKFEHMDLPVGWLGPVPAEPVLKYASLAGRRFWSVIASVPVYPAH